MNRIISLSILFLILVSHPLTAADDTRFAPIFNGIDLSGWVDRGGFGVEDGILVTRGKEGKDLFSEKTYGNYILRLEFMLSDVGNSGVQIRANPDNAYRGGFEVQLLAPWTPYRDDLHCTASIYGHVAVTNRPDETTGRWYRMEIVCDRKDIAISVNDEVCTHGNMDSVETLKDKNLRGAVGLQFNHAEKEGQWVKFRNLSIRDLDSEPEYVIKGFADTDWRVRQSAHDAAVALGSVMIGPLAAMMSGNDPMAVSGAKQTLFDITAAASAPGTDPDGKNALIAALQAQINTLQPDTRPSQITRDYLIWLLGMLAN